MNEETREEIRKSAEYLHSAIVAFAENQRVLTLALVHAEAVFDALERAEISTQEKRA